MGVPKGLLEYEGRTWLEHQLERAGEAGITQAILVLGYHVNEYEAVLSKRKDTPPELIAVVNPKPEQGQFSSIICGTKAATEIQDLEGAFLLPIDTPSPRPEVWRELAAARSEEQEALQPEVDGQAGHPVLISRSFVETLSRHSPEFRLDLLIKSLPERKKKRVVVSDSRIVTNLNDPQAWNDFQKIDATRP
jgi:CTP:molybdopterin cytidylyltransferase MocA